MAHSVLRPWLINPMRLSVGSSFRPPSSLPHPPPSLPPPPSPRVRDRTPVASTRNNVSSGADKQSNELCSWFFLPRILGQFLPLNLLCAVNRHLTVEYVDYITSSNRKSRNNRLRDMFLACISMCCYVIHRSHHGHRLASQSING